MVSNKCMICLEPVYYYGITDCNCKIYTHKSCIVNWLKLNSSCIICKKYLKINISQTNLRLKYFNDTFSKSKLISFINILFENLEIYSLIIKNLYLRIFLFNIIFGLILFLFLLPILIMITIKSQTKYFIDNVKNNKQDLYFPIKFKF